MTPPGLGFDLAALRERYPALETKVGGKSLVYLDNACTALKPRCVAERLADFYLHWGGCGGKRSTHLMSQQVEASFASARAEVASFLNAEKPGEIVFTASTTDAVNLVARAFPYEEGRREVVVTELEHNSVLLPFVESAARGEIDLAYCPVKDDGPDLEALDRLITRRTALVAFAHSSNVLGGAFPAARIARLAHAKGARVLVDDAQYLSSHRHDVQETNADFVAFSAHKLGGPFGVGALYGKEHLLNRLRHYKVGGGTVREVEWSAGAAEPRYLDAPARFEAGVPNFGGALAFADALRELRALPAAAVRAHVESLVRRAVAGLRAFPAVALLGEPETLARGSLVSFYPVGDAFSVRDLGLWLNCELPERFFAVRVGEHCAHLLHKARGVAATVRLSFFAYNTPEEVDLFLDALGVFLREARA